MYFDSGSRASHSVIASLGDGVNRGKQDRADTGSKAHASEPRSGLRSSLGKRDTKSTMKPLQASTKFEFVVSTPSYNASAQKSTQRLVRKHVMRPWTTRKCRPRAVVLKDDDLAEYLARRQDRENTGYPLVLSLGSPSMAAALIGASRPNPFGRYPINISDKELELIHHIWASGQVIFQPFRVYWFSLGMLDPAAMHLVIANAALHLEALRPSPSREDNLVALTHVEAAMTSVNQRIPDSRQNATDEILGAILGLMCHALNSLRFDHYARHIEGFQTILDLRGGLRSIESATNIRLSLLWIEFNTCAAQDAIPRFLPPFHLIKNPYSAIHESLGRDHFEKAMQISGISSFLTAEMLDVFSELSLLTMALRAETPQRIRWDDDNFPGFGFYPTLHKLLTMQVNPAEDDLKHGVHEMCRLGALFFLAEVRRKFGIAPVITGVQSEKLHRLFEYNGRLWHEELAHMRIWTLVMAACAADTRVDRSWAVKSLVGSESSIIGAWDKLIGVVANKWWIDEVFLAKSEGLQAEFRALSSS